MPMDFVAQQEHARRKTSRLMLYFVAAVVAMSIVIYLLVAVIFLGSGRGHTIGAKGLWNPALFLAVSSGTVGIVVCGCLLKINELSYGGSSLAMRMGGHQLNPNSTDPDERKLLNVVEEMAIASGVPVPPVYLLHDEQGINAFAAGYAPKDAIIGVTQGCMKLLTRDELQGVIAHEFSHILNGDMRLNMRLIGWVFGILSLTVVGKILLRSRGQKNPLPLVGLVLMVVGSVGAFFGRLIQSAVSRQREFLADASAVQFTRNPDGLGGALKKIGGLSRGSRLSTDYADEAGHLFFGNALGGGWFGWLATHPPLEERIRRIDASFDGKFPRVAIPAETMPAPPRQVPQAGRPFGILDALGGAAAALPSVPAANVLSQIGKPLPEHLARAAGILGALPGAATRAAREPFDANALIFALLLSSDETVRARQLKSLEAQSNTALLQATGKLFPAIAGLERDARLALAEMAMPALRRLTSSQYGVFIRSVQGLVEADQEIDLFEYAMQKMLRRHLESHFRPGQKAVVQYYVLKPMIEDSVVLLSALAHIGQEDEARIRAAFQAGLTRLGLDAQRVAMLAGDECNLPQIDQALDHLGQASLQIRSVVLDACAQTVASDGILQAREAELLRAVADTLDCPIPPFIAQAQA
ncbi:MAG: hypothetical protein DME18_09055 [Verrucomicrobia bacterium]|nr:MAG: hypothetical protein DME18_09055 [Verrucomicrobiota bacterium]